MKVYALPTEASLGLLIELLLHGFNDSSVTFINGLCSQIDGNNAMFSSSPASLIAFN